MPFKSEKQRKWMHANEPEMAKKWEKEEEAIKGKLRNLIKQEIKSINEGFDKYYLGGLGWSVLKKKLEIAIKKLKGKVDGVGMDYIHFRMPSSNMDVFTALIAKLDKDKNVWIGDKRKKNIWDRRRNIDKLREGPRPGHRFLRAKQMVFLPGEKIYFDPMTTYFWTMGPHGGPDLDDDPIEPSEKYFYQKIIKKLKSKDKAILKKAMRTNPAQKRIRAKQRKEATTSTSVPGYLTPLAFKKSTQKAIDVDDEDDEKNESINERKLSSHQKKAILIAIQMSGNMTGATKKIEKIKKGLSNDKKVKDALRLANESMAAPFRRRNSRGLGRPMKEDNIKFSKEEMAQLHKDGKVEKGGHTIEFGESVNESDLGLTYKKGKTVKVTHKKSGKELVIIDKPNVRKEYEKIGFFAEGKVNEDFWAKPAGWSNQEARLHLDKDIKDMSKILGKASQQVIKVMMNGVKGDRYDALDIQRGLEYGPANRTHTGEAEFMKMLWRKVRDGFRRYSKRGKLRK